MHATIRSYSGVAGLVDGILANEDAIRGLLRGIDGFRAYYLVRTSDDSAVSVSVYDDRAGTEASTAAAREWIAANLPGLATSPPKVSDGEVALEA
jgi:heme-degrading monooxygenase HmoA